VGEAHHINFSVECTSPEWSKFVKSEAWHDLKIIRIVRLPLDGAGDDVTNTSQLSQLCQVSCQGVTTVCIDGDGRYLAAVTDGGKRLCIWRAHLEGCTLR
jgi:hypothetical protein